MANASSTRCQSLHGRRRTRQRQELASAPWRSDPSHVACRCSSSPRAEVWPHRRQRMCWQYFGLVERRWELPDGDAILWTSYNKGHHIMECDSALMAL